MKKFIASLLVCIMTVVMLAGCGAAVDGSGSPAPTKTAKPTPTPTPYPMKTLTPVPSYQSDALYIDGDTGWKYGREQGGVVLYGYEGDEVDVTIPEELNVVLSGDTREVMPVVGLDSIALCYKRKIFEGNSVYYCDIEKLTIPDSFDSIPDDLFQQCDNLKEVSWKGFKVVNNIVYSKDMSVLYYCLNKDIANVTIPSSVKTIAAGAFRGCMRLTKMDIPGTVEKIGNYAFYKCDKLRTVTLNEGVKTLGFEALTRCVNLETLILPSSLESIGYAFFTPTQKVKIHIEEGCFVDKYFKGIVDPETFFGEQMNIFDYIVYVN